MIPNESKIKNGIRYLFIELLMVYLVIIILMIASCHKTGRDEGLFNKVFASSTDR